MGEGGFSGWYRLKVCADGSLPNPMTWRLGAAPIFAAPRPNGLAWDSAWRWWDEPPLPGWPTRDAVKGAMAGFGSDYSARLQERIVHADEMAAIVAMWRAQREAKDER